MTVVIVDWLGRGGIAQTSEAWAMELKRAGHEVVVVTRAERELGSGSTPVVGAGGRGGRVAAHLAVARRAASVIRQRRPDVVVVQNYVIPALEGLVHRAAAASGARVIVVVHDHQLHSRAAGTRGGLRRWLERADVVVAHTEFVADAVRAYARRDVSVVPHPVQVGMLEHPMPDDPVFVVPDGVQLALHFGVLKRGYKGTATVVELAAGGVAGWTFGIVGAGARPTAGALVAGGFMPPGRLRAAVHQSHATLLPYSIASQSGAVVLAQVEGSVPVASAVGGIPEQIEDGVTGRLLPAGAPAAQWAEVLQELDPTTRAAIGATAAKKAWNDHERFVSEVRSIVDGG